MYIYRADIVNSNTVNSLFLGIQSKLETKFADK